MKFVLGVAFLVAVFLQGCLAEEDVETAQRYHSSSGHCGVLLILENNERWFIQKQAVGASNTLAVTRIYGTPAGWILQSTRAVDDSDFPDYLRAAVAHYNNANDNSHNACDRMMRLN